MYYWVFLFLFFVVGFLGLGCVLLKMINFVKVIQFHHSCVLQMQMKSTVIKFWCFDVCLTVLLEIIRFLIEN